MKEPVAASTPYYPERWISTLRKETLLVWRRELTAQLEAIDRERGRLGTGVSQIDAELAKRETAKNAGPKAPIRRNA